MYNYYQQQQTTSPINPRPQPMVGYPTVQPGLKGHQVSGLDEVKATSIDFDGSIFYFPDIANKRIYTKVVNMDGSATVSMYELKPLPPDNVSTGDFITRQEFESAMTRISELFASQQQDAAPQPSETKFKEVF